ncbi:lantibiotic immunity ABC transporter MutG family permease subunit [Clostridium uliginosum]|uniref:ABC-2 type transport system permease protein n=1 Tax=Clostridium uliginosum TaxID=119641 RepID=A0A1I1JGE9_9CLOT|nr:lantibiotic immunity ABC transporter MutG family permease subunit [Clostridium uliginosum]SFC47231.1 ABC-2 type transport system permease protein [Clostridium uliginosum]
MYLIRAMRSDWIKTKKTAFRYIVILVPILFPLLVLTYISNYKLDYTFQIRVYSLYFETVGIAITMIAAILTGINIMGEESAGEFRGLRTSPISRTTIYLSKLLMLILITVIDMFVAIGILLLGMKFSYHGANIQYGMFLEGTLFTTIGALFLYGLYLIISINFGIGPTMVIGTGGTLWAVLFQTGMGDRMWQFVPWAWSGRLGTLPIAMLSGFTKFHNMDDNFVKNLYITEMYKGMPIALISFVVISVIGVLWFKRWEGRKIHQ